MLLLHYGHWWTDSVTVRPSLSLSSRSVTLFPGAHIVRQFINEWLPWIDRSSPFSLHWLIADGSRRGAFTYFTGGCSSLAVPVESTHMTQYVTDASCARKGSWWLWCFRINWVAKTIWSAKRKMWIVPRMSFGFSNLSSYFWISATSSWLYPSVLVYQPVYVCT